MLYAYDPEIGTSLTRTVAIYASAVLVAAYHVYAYILLFRIYKLFAPEYAAEFLTPSILLTLTIPVFSLIPSFKKPCFPEEDSGMSSEPASKIIE